MRINVSELLVTQTSSNNSKWFGYYTEGSYIRTYYKALKHSKVSSEKLEYRNKLNDK